MAKQLYEDQYVNVGGINTRFWTAGDEGTVIILVHGVFSSVDWWSANMPTLAENHRVYAVDMPGFGLTDKIPMSSLSQLAQFIDDFMKTQNIQRANLIGHSMGGGCTSNSGASSMARFHFMNALYSGGKLTVVVRLVYSVKGVNDSR